MFSLDAVSTRLPIVLVVDPEAASRQAMWRSLSRSFGVLEAADAWHARDWLTRRPNIDALVLQKELPDADGGEFVEDLLAAHASVAAHVILVSRPVDLRIVLKSLVGWFFSRDVRKAQALLREADRFVS